MHGEGLQFLWLELTNRCNLRCVHCYTDSHPGSGHRDRLTTEDLESVLRQAYALGCRSVQFIGGEPQLYRDFRRLLGTASDIGFTLIEVFSNLTQLREETLEFAAEAGIRFATSVYSDDPAEHDAITQVRSSHARTIGNLRRLVERGVGTRAAVIQIDQAPGLEERTTAFLHRLGVTVIRVSKVSAFGRGEDLLGGPAGLDGLCGHCWDGRLCVAPDGTAYSCVMARDWPVGTVLGTPLADIVDGAALASVRQRVYHEVYAPRVTAAAGAGVRKPTVAGLTRIEPCGPDELAGCEPIAPCEPEPDLLLGGSVGCDVCNGGEVVAPTPPCPQSCAPSAPPAPCPQSSSPCPQSSVLE